MRTLTTLLFLSALTACGGGGPDDDGDGFAADVDCDDTNAAVHPDAVETCNGVDDNCDTAIDEDVMSTFYADADGDSFGAASTSQDACTAPDGYVADSTDCDDATATAFPGATETCNGVDDNCNNAVDDGVTSTFYADGDGDSFGDATTAETACAAPTGYVTDNTDCDDTVDTTFPSATETCNGVDDNCDLAIDEGLLSTFYADVDADSYGDAATTTEACDAPAGYVTDATDCDDAVATTHPGAAELCNSVDDNCDTLADDDDPAVTDQPTSYADTDGDGFGDAAGATATACISPTGFVTDATDCNDADPAINPGATEIWYDGVDQDCAGDDDYDADGDGRQSQANTTTGKDCNDNDATEFLCGSSITTAMPSCRDIRNTRGVLPSGTYYIDPAGAGAFPVLCDMVTNNGGWTLCGKFDRDNGATSWLSDPFARADEHLADLADATTFTGSQASQDCRELIRDGATVILVAGTDTGAEPWDAARITNMFFEVKTDPTNLWDITLDEDPNATTAANFAVNTYGTDLTPLKTLGANDGTNNLGDRCGLVSNGAMWVNVGRTGAAWSNAGKKDVNGVCNDTASDTIYWAWEATDFSVDDHSCGTPVIGTGCGNNKATYRYNLMFMR